MNYFDIIKHMKINLSSLSLALAMASAFNVFGESAYISSDGTQAIDTGYYANPRTCVAVDFSYLKTTSQSRIFGADVDQSDGTLFTFCSYVNSSGWYAWAVRDGQGNWRGFTNNTDPNAKANLNRRTIVVDSANGKAQLLTGGAVTVEESITTTRTLTSPRSLAIFGNNRANLGDNSFSPVNNQFASAKLYALKIWDDGRLVRYFLPYAFGSITGLKDAISGEIYQSWNGRSFGYGGDIGVYEGFDQNEIGSVSLCSDYEVVDGKLVDMSLPYWRKNDGVLEYRVSFSNPGGVVSIGSESSRCVERWVPYGTTATFTVVASMHGDNPFQGWNGTVGAISGGAVNSETISVSASGPVTLAVRSRNLDDPYSDATGWIRAFGSYDDTLASASSIRGGLANRELWSSAAINNQPAITNEWVAMPFRGCKRFLPTLYLGQPVTITNETLNTGYARLDSITLNNFTPNVNVTTNNLTFAIRFRPDFDQFRNDYCWMFNWGYNNSLSGFNLGLYQHSVETLTIGDKSFTYRRYTPTLFKSGQTTQVFDTQGIVHSDKWHDLIVSIDGTNKKIRYLLCRAPWDPQLHSITAGKASDNGGDMTYSNEVNMNEGINFTPSSYMLIGSESASSAGNCVYTNAGKIVGNYTKCYRGSIQQLAVWNRAMSIEEMKQALANPRSDLMRVGARDGSSKEFRGGSITSQDDREWTLPQYFKPNDTATIKFVSDRIGEGEMPQLLRWYSASDSISGSIRTVLNGVDLGVKAVKPCEATQWKVPGGTVIDGTNTLTVTRIDDNSGHVMMDAIALGGSWQIGLKNNDITEFAAEWKGIQTVDVLNGNWMAIKRVLFGAHKNAQSEESSNTNTVYKFSVPHEFRGGNYGWKLVWKDRNSGVEYLPRFRFNDNDLGYTGTADSALHSIDIPQPYLSDGENRLEIYNDGTYVQGHYYSYDYIRMEIRPRSGFMIIVR